MAAKTKAKVLAGNVSAETMRANAERAPGRVSAAEFRLLPVGALTACAENPRRIVEGVSLKELSESIARVGVLEPLLVRPVNGLDGRDGHDGRESGDASYEIRAGERRWRAAVMAGLEVVPCMVREMSDAEALEVTVTENLQRVDLHPLEESAGIRMLSAGGWTLEECAAQLGKSTKWIARRSSLGNLAGCWLWALGMLPSLAESTEGSASLKGNGETPRAEAMRLSAERARAGILNRADAGVTSGAIGAPGGMYDGLEGAMSVDGFARLGAFWEARGVYGVAPRGGALAEMRERISVWGAAHWETLARYPAAMQEKTFIDLLDPHGDDPMTLRAGDLAAHLSGLTRELSTARWDLNAALGGCVCCTECPKRSDRQGELLFDPEEGHGGKTKGARCLDSACWDLKAVEHLRAARARATAKHGAVELVWCVAGSGLDRDAAIRAFELTREAGLKLAYEYSVVKAKAKTPGARPAMLIGGQDEGKVIWIAPKARESGASSSAKASKGAADAAVEKTKDEVMEEKKAAVDAKRESQFLRSAIDALVEMGDVDRLDPEGPLVGGITTERLLAVAAVFGLGGVLDDVDLVDEFDPQNTWALVRALEDDEPRVVTLILQSLARRLGGPSGLVTVDDGGESVRMLCEIFLLDWREFEAAAAEMYPYPKAVAKWLESDARGCE